MILIEEEGEPYRNQGGSWDVEQGKRLTITRPRPSRRHTSGKGSQSILVTEHGSRADDGRFGEVLSNEILTQSFGLRMREVRDIQVSLSRHDGSQRMTDGLRLTR
jgi:hypothetical protein